MIRNYRIKAAFAHQTPNILACLRENGVIGEVRTVSGVTFVSADCNRRVFDESCGGWFVDENEAAFEKLAEYDGTKSSVNVRFLAGKSGKVLTWSINHVSVLEPTERSMGGGHVVCGDRFLRCQCHLGHRTIDVMSILEVY